ncbi:DNA-binding MurR/RpiR family transcriptional regulator [Gracilibacillus halotolerans]|uniref:DNA-binding MurR/RpiR family transcriptional regulator n=1 Tax=Gracilibacillus halotolerans TaxID=74386 RepID=A0A841RP79_9BACI|nr:MurR/RpiR family transcriptional regulator [Gracilibacillus halotolerans]MBB6512744.1 DNA-binding MurR/RpiR family transcriptional regulator [Gracilibacillus halotolerans]
MRIDYTHLTESQWKIANYIERHLEEVLLSTEQEIANKLGISIATVSRFWKAIGYQNLKAFKHDMKEELAVSPAGKIRNTGNNLSGGTFYLSVEKGVGLLQETMDHQNPKVFERSIDALMEANRIFILALGPAKGLAELLNYRMARYGKKIHLIQQHGHELFEEMIHFKKEDIIIIFAFTRLLPEAKVLLQYQREKHFQSILITDQLAARFSSSATYTLFASRGEANEFHSMLGPTILIENMILSLGLREKEENIKRLEKLAELRKKFSVDLPR